MAHSLALKNDRNDELFGLEKQGNLRQFTLSLCETGTKSPILLLEKWWHDGSPSLIRPHHFYSLPSKTLFTGIGVRVIWSRFPGLLSRKDFREPTAGSKSHRKIKLCEIKLFQTLPCYDGCGYSIFMAKFRKVGQTFFICSPLIKATMHVIIFHSIFIPSSPTSSLSKSKPWAWAWAARSTVST